MFSPVVFTDPKTQFEPRVLCLDLLSSSTTTALSHRALNSQSRNFCLVITIQNQRMDFAATASRSSSRQRLPSRPTTPLRPSSRSSFREAHGYGDSIGNAGYTQPAINALEPQFAELADSMADLEANFMHLQLMHESLTRFSESFASFLYGLNMNAFCVDFSEV